MDCYRELYKYSSPPADFDKLMDKAKTNDLGQKIIKFMDYEIPKELYQDIVDKATKDNNIKGVMKQSFKTTIALGCSPKFKTK